MRRRLSARGAARWGLRLALGVLAAACLAPAEQALAEEVRVVPLLLNLSNAPLESSELAFRESLKSGPKPAPRAEPEWEFLPDGSARYGTGPISVIVKNPCPDGTHKPLPGRRPR